MGVGGEVVLAHPAKEFPERRPSRGVRAQYQGVDEKTDKLFQRLVRTAGDHAAERDIGARAEPGQQRRQPGLHDHEQRGSGLPRQFHQAAVQVRADLEFDLAAPVRRDGRARPVRRELQPFRQPREVFRPERQLLRNQALRIALVPEQFALPQRVVRILHRQRTPLRDFAAQPRRVRG